MAKITIILSTYNGENYLEEQINSLLGQTYTDWQLIIRDDGSTDHTNEIIQKFTTNYPEKIKKLQSEGNCGVIKSFETLLQESDSDYISFCDQDDVWLPNKIELTIAKLIEEEKKHNNCPIGIYTDLTVVDKKLKTINPSFWQYSKINPAMLTTFDDLCVHPAATGCTLMINRKAKACSLPFCEEVRMHDAWIVLNILKHGGYINYVDTPTMLYRQHDNNVVGARNENHSYIYNRLRNLKNVLKGNREQWRMIKKLGFNSPLKYIYLKISYILQYKIKQN